MRTVYELVKEVEFTRGRILEMEMTDAIVCGCEIRLGDNVETIDYRTFFDTYDSFTLYDVLFQAFMDRDRYLENRYRDSDEERLRNLANSLENLFGEDVDLVAEYYVKEIENSTFTELDKLGSWG